MTKYIEYFLRMKNTMLSLTKGKKILHINIFADSFEIDRERYQNKRYNSKYFQYSWMIFYFKMSGYKRRINLFLFLNPFLFWKSRNLINQSINFDFVQLRFDNVWDRFCNISEMTERSMGIFNSTNKAEIRLFIITRIPFICFFVEKVSILLKF